MLLRNFFIDTLLLNANIFDDEVILHRLTGDHGIHNAARRHGHEARAHENLLFEHLPARISGFEIGMRL